MMPMPSVEGEDGQEHGKGRQCSESGKARERHLLEGAAPPGKPQNHRKGATADKARLRKGDQSNYR